MNIYKVNFENNIAVSAFPVSALDFHDLKELKVEESKTVIKWCIVDADYENEAIDRANKTVKERWPNILK